MFRRLILALVITTFATDLVLVLARLNAAPQDSAGAQSQNAQYPDARKQTNAPGGCSTDVNPPPCGLANQGGKPLQAKTVTAKACGEYHEPVCGSPEQAGGTPGISGVSKSSGFWYADSLSLAPQESLVTPPMTVSPEALSAANETKEALKKFYFRMVMDYGPCGGDGAPHGGCPPGSELLKKYQAAFLHNGGKEVFSASELQREAEDHAGYGQWVFMFYNLERAVNVHLYWLDQFTRGKATLAFEDKSLGLDTVRSNEFELRRQLDHYIDLDARGRVMDVKGVNQIERRRLSLARRAKVRTRRRPTRLE